MGRPARADVATRHLAEDDGWTYVEMFAGDVFVLGKRVALLRRPARAPGVPETDLVLDGCRRCRPSIARRIGSSSSVPGRAAPK